jgi:Tol biopolymer transport system component
LFKIGMPEELPAMTGQTVSHYRILEKLGGGGMGVVYKARDTHLDRFVALKVLPPEKVADPDRKRRFVQEAKAASALNHPNIITIYDIDHAEVAQAPKPATLGGPPGPPHFIDFIVMEYVPGKTLDELIPRKGGALGSRLNKVLKVAVQIADALAAAHASGIVHRDLKPGNVMLTEDGRVKVLDFGLAKLTQTAELGEDDSTRTLEPATEEGAILGTVAYMSPEQAQGKPVDARSDIFSFGSLLYEMVSGRRAFQSDTKISTLAAIIHQEPAPLAAETPRDLEKIITRCLRKDPERRFQTMADARVSLLELKEDTDSGKLAAELPSRPRRRVWAAGIAALFLVAVVAAWLYLRKPAHNQEPKTTVFTSYTGMQFWGSFSPDGNQVAFTWQGEKQDNYDIYVKVIGTENPLRLTTHPAPDGYAQWAPDGRSIAFLRMTSERTAAIYTVAPLGGSERKIADVAVSNFWYLGGGLCWSREGKWILSSDADSPGKPTYIVVVSSETGEKRKLTSGEGLGESNPALAPDNRTLAFCRRLTDAQSLLFLLALDAELKPKAPARQLRPAGLYNLTPAWTPDGKSLVFTSYGSDWFNSARLWRVSIAGDSLPAPMPQAADGSFAPALSPQGKRLVFTRYFQDSNIWRIDVSSRGGQAGPPRQIVSSTREDRYPVFSPDGGRIAFESSRSGAYGIWLANADGSNPQPLIADPGYWSGHPAWSPDGHTIAFETTKDKQAELYLINPEGGAPRRLTNHPSDDVAPSWSRDGRWIYFSSNRTGRFEVWRVSAAGGEAVQLTRNGGYAARESPDGRTLFFERYRATSLADPPSLWKMPANGGEESKVLNSVSSQNWNLAEQGLWLISYAPPGVQFLEFATGHTR